MKRVLITAWILAVASIGLATVAQAVQPAGQKPYVHVSPTPHSLDLGTAPGPGFYDIPKALTLRVESNCLHGPIMISATDLTGSSGRSIPPERFFVRSPATWGFVPMSRSVAVSKTQSGCHDIVLDFQVETGTEEMAGTYQGALTVTVMPPV